MTYQVLARKSRPQNFQQMVGQQHVVRALTNALDSGRLHHTYLFTGTRGVGKTSIARILAKCFNCEQGVSSTPCGSCGACKEIEQGRFVDLLEIDAASRTKVEDTRDLLNNVHYAPVRGRYKVYLIDEVHMLSGHSFNALLKTLEEPPKDVVFILATTDPQRLPPTVLSRCLQFQLKALSTPEIIQQMAMLLQQEGVTFEMPALQRLAQAAAGSMRDGLSLLDQAIAYGNHQLTDACVREMLGTLASHHTLEILEALANRNGAAVIDKVAQIALEGADFANALEELLSLLHQLALVQVVPEAPNASVFAVEAVSALASRLSKQDVQLYYQIGVMARRDFALAPTPRGGFEMALLRMLAFSPQQVNAIAVTHSQPVTAPMAITVTPPAPPVPVSLPPEQAKTESAMSSDWHQIFPALKLNGMTKVLASYCLLAHKEAQQIELLIHKDQALLLSDKQVNYLTEALTEYYGETVTLKIRPSQDELDCPAVRTSIETKQALTQAQTSINQDPHIQALQQRFDAKVSPESIKSRELPSHETGDH